MLGLMQDWPLLLHKVIDFAAIQHPGREVVSRTIEGPMHRSNYKQLRDRSLKGAQRLARDGVRLGDRVATLAWNGYRHLETWYAIVGLGAIYHTVNPRLFPEQIAWIINHAEDRIIFTDLTFVPLLEALADKLPTVERYIVLTDSAHMPATRLRNAIAYETWLAEADGDFRWAEFDERTAAGLCYTSGTTGNPKGVLYSHRSNVIHSMASTGGDGLLVLSSDAVLPIVPMFHANSWSLAFSCPMRGAKMVMPGAKLDGASVYELLESEKVTMTAAVPTVWLMLLQYLRQENKRPTTLKLIAIGGSACPPAMIRAFEVDYGIEVRHAWGMTEMSPIGSTGSIKPIVADLPREELLALKSKQGWAPFGVEMKIVDDDEPRTSLGRQDVRSPQGRRRRRIERLFQGRRRRHPRRERLLRHRRRRDHRSQRLHADHRPRQGRHQVGRRVDFLDRHRKSGGRPSRHPGGGGHRRRAIPNGTSGRCWSSCPRKARRRGARTCSISCRAGSRNGGCPTTSSW